MTEAIEAHVDEIRRLVRRLLHAERSIPAARSTTDPATQTDPPSPFNGRTMRIFRPPHGSDQRERRAYGDGVADAFQYLSPGEVPLIGRPYSSYSEEYYNEMYEAEADAAARRDYP